MGDTCCWWEQREVEKGGMCGGDGASTGEDDGYAGCCWSAVEAWCVDGEEMAGAAGVSDTDGREYGLGWGCHRLRGGGCWDIGGDVGVGY